MKKTAALIRAGGAGRLRAVIDTLESASAGTDVSSLLPDLEECVLDPDLGTYLRAYQIFDLLVDQGADLTRSLPVLVTRAQDFYRSGQRLQASLCRYAERSPADADAVLSAVREAGIPPEPVRRISVDPDFTATDNERMMNPAEEIEMPPEWVIQVKLAAQGKIKAGVLRWGGCRVEISGGRLTWYDNSGGSYSQTYSEFLEKGPRLLWIDRTMPESIRQDLYHAVGARAPYEKPLEKRRSEFLEHVKAWTQKERRAEPCPVCSGIPVFTSRGENNRDGRWDNLPPERSAFVDVMQNLHGRKIIGCEKCGQLYETWHEHDNVMGMQEDVDNMQKVDAGEIRKRWLRDVEEGERLTLF